MINKEFVLYLKQVAAITLLAGIVCVIGIASSRLGEHNSAASEPGAAHTAQGIVTSAQAASKPSAGQPSNYPAPPAVFLDTEFQPPAGRKTTVAGGAAAAHNLQQALDGARPGDTLLLEAGATFTGNFVLPKKAGDGWVVIRSAIPDAQLPPAGSRLTPAQAARFAKLVTPNADPVLKTAPGAHHYRLVGLEFTVNPAQSITYDLIQLGNGTQTALTDVPHDLTIDRCYIHGSAKSNLRRGVALNSARTAIIDSHISDCHERGADSQAICGWNGPGPFKIVNNYLEGAGENVMFGGADPKIAGLVPSDIEFRRNHLAKPLSWKKGHASFAGEAWSVKNIFELKNARRVLVDGNTFENNWVDAQNGTAILFTVRNQEGSAPWCVIEDVTFTNNVVRHSAAAFNLLGRDNNQESAQAARLRIHNNLVYDVGGKAWGGNGCFMQISETRDVIVDHNTVLHRGNIIIAHGAPNEGFVFTNNLMAHNEYGVIGDGTGPGKATLGKYFPNPVFRKNVLAGGRSALYPPDNFFPVALEGVSEQSFALTETSGFKRAATDGGDIGCDLRALVSAAGSLAPSVSPERAATEED